jgi:ammonia channel protein AmtB
VSTDDCVRSRRCGAAQEGCTVLHVDSGDTAWILASAALVMFMTPGLAFFYGGLVRAKNVVGTIMQSFIALALVTVLWVVGGAIGVLLTGAFASLAINAAGAEGSLGQVGKQAVLTLVTVVYSFAATLVILKVTDVTVGVRVTDEHEVTGLDLSQHGEVGYRF